MTLEQRDVVDAMVRYGGSFVSQLGRAFLLADAENFRRLQVAFPEYWERYLELAQLHQTRMKVREAECQD